MAAKATAGERAAALIGRVAEAQRQATGKVFTGHPSVKRLLAMTRAALARADRAIDRVNKLVPPEKPVACGAGCPFCCHIRLTASPPEILLVADHLRQTQTPAELEVSKRRVANMDYLTRGKNEARRETMRLPCAMLVDRSCAIHKVRPLSCRAVASVDLPACERAYASRMSEPVPQVRLQGMAADGVGYGLIAGLAESGHDVENLEFNAGLNIALETDNAAQRWLHGDDLFAPAMEVEDVS
ncbi:MAG: YkgJ family cysteine cluster protein [Alphaproteobacteria bacterium]|jgi:Fe-S-cluster containining protein|nr:YkgJ family cysteine cluster protein [Alphaproteobacteria bacterium]MDP6829435.1 YkgJ family cysteine cluster protein [Alphaproteobacteria bacterium]